MSKHSLGAYPQRRMRRMRHDDFSRRLMREISVQVELPSTAPPQVAFELHVELREAISENVDQLNTIRARVLLGAPG